jgi:hypothetical protein
MNIKYTLILTFVTGMFVISSCKSDQATQSDATPSEESHDHSGHDHHDHNHEGHNHEGHDHGNKYEGMSDEEITKQKAIEKAQAQGLVKPTGNNGVHISKRGIPNPCQLISVDWLMQNTSLKVKKEATVRSGSKAADTDNRSCFVQWDYNGDVNSGFLINIMVNPVPEEVTDFPETYMLAKKMDGESMVGSDKPFPYKKISNLGVEALGCYELGKYYWRQDNDYLFMMAFNMDLSQKEQEKAFMTIAKEVTKNFNASL